MQVLILLALTFGVCFLVDKGIQKLFRSKPHRDGEVVRLNKLVATFGVVMLALGCIAVVAAIGESTLFLIAGCLLAVIGLALTVYYLSFGVYYDEEGFLLSVFGRRSVSYRYEHICTQQLYIIYGRTVIELHLNDGRTVQLQQDMTNVNKFMDKAFAGWLQQKGMAKEDCSFYDPDNSCWFPPLEES